jgi:hypothetical protein
MGKRFENDHVNIRGQPNAKKFFMYQNILKSSKNIGAALHLPGLSFASRLEMLTPNVWKTSKAG